MVVACGQALPKTQLEQVQFFWCQIPHESAECLRQLLICNCLQSLVTYHRYKMWTFLSSSFTTQFLVSMITKSTVMCFGFLYFLPSYRCEVHEVIFQYHEQWCLLCYSMWTKWNKESLFWCIRHPILFLQLVNSTMEVFDTDKDGFLNISEFSTLMWTSGLELRWWPTRHYGYLEWHERMKNTQEEVSKQGLFPVYAALHHV